MVKYSRWNFIKNVLARVIYFADVKLNNFQEAQAKAEKMIFIQYQNAASEYLKGFKGSPYYLKNVEGILCVTGRKIEGAPKTMKLVPPGYHSTNK